METDVERKLLKTAIEKLSGRERMIIELRFGLNTSDGGRRRHRKRWQICLESPSPISQDLRKKKIMGRLKKKKLYDLNNRSIIVL